VEPGGAVEVGFEPVREAFAAVLAGPPDGQPPAGGASVAVWHDGRWVVDLFGGYADRAAGRRWQPDTLVQVYSVTKPFVAVCALLLVQRGRLELDAPVQRYWPGFQAPVDVRQVLSHQAGLVTLDQPLPVEAWYDWDRICTALAGQQPAWEPGHGHGESVLLYGHLVGELVRRVDGRLPGRFLREEVCGRLGLDFAVGLEPAEQARAATLTGLTEQFRTDSLAGKPALYGRARGNPPGALDPDVVNGPAWRAAQVPAVNGHGTARGIAGFYAALMAGELLPPDLLRAATTAHCAGPDLVMGHHTSWALGFALEPDGFGMAGLGGSLGWASTQGGYAIGFTTATLGTHAPVIAVENALRGCLGLPALD
jgi:CubicO group peptidase (beta-lactamase class C family)